MIAVAAGLMVTLFLFLLLVWVCCHIDKEYLSKDFLPTEDITESHNYDTTLPPGNDRDETWDS